MNTYIVQIEVSDAQEDVWQAVDLSEPCEADSADEAARETLANQDIAEGPRVRVLVWGSAEDHANGAEPAYIGYADDE